ncbi:MAG: ComF family protein [Pseudomonadota bacterium]
MLPGLDWLGVGCCQVCGVVSSQVVCTACDMALPRNQHACQQCAVPLAHTADAVLCGECLSKPPPFSATCAPFIYQAPIRDWISQFKYQRALHWGRWLGTALGQTVQAQTAELIIPVPLHATRLCQRGFNQAAELAHWASRQVQIPWRTDILQRIHQGMEQQRLSRRERQRNMHRQFRVVKPITAQCVALLDDVVTTGATVRAAAHALRQAGVPRVVVWAVARTPKPDTAFIQHRE